MPNRLSDHIVSTTMAVAVRNHHPGGGLKLSGVKRRYRFRSFHHPDLLDFLCFSPPHFQRSHSTPCFPSSSSYEDSIARVKIVGSRTSPGVHALVAEVTAAMACGTCLVPAASGLGGAYFLPGPGGECLAVVKPVQDLPNLFALGRPASRLCIGAGDTSVREAAAYLLDHADFAGVPPTSLIRISCPAFSGDPKSRVASIQRFIPHDFDAGDLGPSRFSVASVHRIGILDVRLLNTDRHAGNLLVQKLNMFKNHLEETIELVPIDHGLCLPEHLDDPYFEWLHWPQAAVPFSNLEIEYVSKLDPFKDAELLRAELPSLRESAIRILIICTIFLKTAVGAGLCLVDIGGMMTREFGTLEESASVLEELCTKAEEIMVADNHLSYLDDDDIGGMDEQKELQFSIDCDEGEPAVREEDVVDFPFLLLSMGNKSSQGEGGGKEDQEKWEREKEMAGVIMTKSVSFTAGDLSCDVRGIQGRKVISFMSMSEDEWLLFLDKFEELLPEAFEVRKNMEMKQRLGSSCRF